MMLHLFLWIRLLFVKFFERILANWSDMYVSVLSIPRFLPIRFRYQNPSLQVEASGTDEGVWAAGLDPRDINLFVSPWISPEIARVHVLSSEYKSSFSPSH